MELVRSPVLLIRSRQLGPFMSNNFNQAAHALRGNGLDRLAARGHPILACYFPLGDPVFANGIDAIYRSAGVDLFELGLPSADPYMDGADVAGAMRRALASGIDPYARLADMAAWLADEPDGPAGVCMAYADLDLSRIAGWPGLDGMLIVGTPPGAFPPGVRTCGLLKLDFTNEDLAAAAAWDGYVMVQAAAGVTGPRDRLDPRLADTIAAARRAGVSRPILAGFGIGTSDQARAAVDAGADGAVIGSMCVRKAMQGPDEIARFLDRVRSALDG